MSKLTIELSDVIAAKLIDALLVPRRPNYQEEEDSSDDDESSGESLDSEEREVLEQFLMDAMTENKCHCPACNPVERCPGCGSTNCQGSEEFQKTHQRIERSRQLGQQFKQAQREVSKNVTLQTSETPKETEGVKSWMGACNHLINIASSAYNEGQENVTNEVIRRIVEFATVPDTRFAFEGEEIDMEALKSALTKLLIPHLLGAPSRSLFDPLVPPRLSHFSRSPATDLNTLSAVVQLLSGERKGLIPPGTTLKTIEDSKKTTIENLDSDEESQVTGGTEGTINQNTTTISNGEAEEMLQNVLEEMKTSEEVIQSMTLEEKREALKGFNNPSTEEKLKTMEQEFLRNPNPSMGDAFKMLNLISEDPMLSSVANSMCPGILPLLSILRPPATSQSSQSSSSSSSQSSSSSSSTTSESTIDIPVE